MRPQDPWPSLKRIAAAFDLDCDRLLAQWQDIQPRAVRHYSHEAPEESRTTSKSWRNAHKDAWTSAIQSLQMHRSTEQSHPSETLKRALVQYLAFGCSTSGVEQAFSKSTWAFHCRRQKASAFAEESAIKVHLDLPLHNKEALAEQASVAWAHCFGMARQRLRARVDKGLSRPKKKKAEDELLTEQEFIKKRRLAATQAGHEHDAAAAADDIDVSEVWTEQHDKQEQVFAKKERSRKLQAFAEKSLLPDEVEDTMEQEVHAARKKLLKNEAARQRKSRAVKIRQGESSATVLQALRGKRAHVAVPASQHLDSLLFHRGCTKSSLKDADIIVCDRPGQLDCRRRLVSSLRGLYEISVGFLDKGAGAALKIRCAGAQRRALLVSRGCAAAYPKFWRFFREALPADHTWALHRLAVNELRNTQARYRAGVAWVVVSPAERQHPAARRRLHF